MNCRICKFKLKRIIDFGKIYLVGNFSKKINNAKKYKISLNFCNKCKHIQIKEKLNPDLLFKNYLWETGISKSNINLINKLVHSLKKYNINNSSKFFEIACNDGIFLKKIQEKLKCKAIGIDPARNLKNKNINKRVNRIVDYFNIKTAKKIDKKFGKFNFILARNVIAHVKNPNEIFKGVHLLLEKNGIFIVEFPSLKDIFLSNQYDNIFHEHIGFHSLKSIYDLCRLNKLSLIDCERIDSQGVSLRCYISSQNNNYKPTLNLKNILNSEKKAGLFKVKKILEFKDKINKHRVKIFDFLKKLKEDNFKISAYGASGKGLALLQYSKIDEEIIDVIFDKSKLKQNKYVLGTKILVKDPKYILNNKVDYLLLLSWNLKKEIVKQEKKFLKKGGRIIIPFPNPRVINR